MAIPLTLNPLYFRANGYDPLASVFNSALRSACSTSELDTQSPAYNIVKLGDQDYAITLAVAGFKESELTITTTKNKLVVSGQHDEIADEQGMDYIHNGFNKRSFESTFRLGEHMTVQHAQLTDGLLHIHLVHEMPQEAKPQTIPISSAAPALDKKSKTN